MGTRVEVRPIELPRDTVAFVKSWWPIYDGDPMWVPPLIFERKQFFDPKKNPYFKVASVQCFMAHREGRPVGTISATVDRMLQAHEPGMGLFGFFEFVDDEEVARALLDAASTWLRERGMKALRGPFNFSANHEFGLLVDGFDTAPCVANPHNRAYYGPIYERLGLRKVMDWYAYWLANDGPVEPSIARVSQRLLDRHPDLVIEHAQLARWDRDIHELWELYNDAWEHNWGHIELTEEEFFHMANGFRQIMDPRLIWFARKNDRMIAASVTLPDVNQWVRRMNGRLFPFGWWHALTGPRKVNQLRVFILGVRKEYQRLPIGAPLYVKTWEMGRELGVKGAEASLILENNFRMRGALEKLGGTIYKTYRSYEMSLTEG